MENEATPPLIVPLPLTVPTATVQAASLYSVKVTEPLGLNPPLKVAVSPTVRATPAVPLVGLARVVKLGLALLTVTCSS